MKNVLLIGDSIRFGAVSNPEYQTSNSPGYGRYVKELLSGEANVYAPDDNCRFAQYTLRYLYDWSKDLECDKIDVDVWCRELTKEQIDACHKAGLTVNCWTVDTVEEATKLIEWGIDYITSNILE